MNISWSLQICAVSDICFFPSGIIEFITYLAFDFYEDLHLELANYGQWVYATTGHFFQIYQ